MILLLNGSEDQIMDASGSKTNIIILDACRDNPLPGGSRSGTRGASDGIPRVCRGGSWNGLADYLRSTNRGDDTPARVNSTIGFRLVRTR